MSASGALFLSLSGAIPQALIFLQLRNMNPRPNNLCFDRNQTVHILTHKAQGFNIYFLTMLLPACLFKRRSGRRGSSTFLSGSLRILDWLDVELFCSRVNKASSHGLLLIVSRQDNLCAMEGCFEHHKSNRNDVVTCLTSLIPRPFWFFLWGSHGRLQSLFCLQDIFSGAGLRDHSMA